VTTSLQVALDRHGEKVRETYLARCAAGLAEARRHARYMSAISPSGYSDAVYTGHAAPSPINALTTQLVESLECFLTAATWPR
jgi:hypothetical protein